MPEDRRKVFGHLQPAGRQDEVRIFRGIHAGSRHLADIRI